MLGLIAQVAVHETIDGSDIEPLVRLALVLPAFVFLLWWLLIPGLSLEEPAEPVALAPIDPEERLDRIEATFDTAAVPRARRHELEQVDGAAHRTYRATIRRDEDQATVDPNSFGIRRPELPAQDTAS